MDILELLLTVNVFGKIFRAIIDYRVLASVAPAHSSEIWNICIFTFFVFLNNFLPAGEHVLSYVEDMWQAM